MRRLLAAYHLLGAHRGACDVTVPLSESNLACIPFTDTQSNGCSDARPGGSSCRWPERVTRPRVSWAVPGPFLRGASFPVAEAGFFFFFFFRSFYPPMSAWSCLSIVNWLLGYVVSILNGMCRLGKSNGHFHMKKQSLFFPSYHRKSSWALGSRSLASHKRLRAFLLSCPPTSFLCVCSPCLVGPKPGGSVKTLLSCREMVGENAVRT